MKNNPLKKALLALGAIVVSHAAFAQLQEEKNVTITMDLQPILKNGRSRPIRFYI